MSGTKGVFSSWNTTATISFPMCLFRCSCRTARQTHAVTINNNHSPQSTFNLNDSLSHYVNSLTVFAPKCLSAPRELTLTVYLKFTFTLSTKVLRCSQTYFFFFFKPVCPTHLYKKQYFECVTYSLVHLCVWVCARACACVFCLTILLSLSVWVRPMKTRAILRHRLRIMC